MWHFISRALRTGIMQLHPNRKASGITQFHIPVFLVDAEGFVTLVNQSRDGNGVLSLVTWQKLHHFA